MDYTKYKHQVNGIGIRIIETGEIFETRTECAEHLGVTVGMISMCLSGKVKTCLGYHLEIVDMDFNHPLTKDVLHELYELTGSSCEWREHPYLKDVYVSRNGLVAKNVNGHVILKRQHLINSGYYVVSVCDYRTPASQNYNRLVHRLVAETFIYNDDPDIYIHVNHIDGDKSNNDASNLEWCTRDYNMRHAYDTGLHDTEKVMVVETGEIFNTAADCARAIGGTVSGIHDCKVGRQRQHRGYTFKFLNDNEIKPWSDIRSYMTDLVIIDIFTGEEAYFSTVYEASKMLGINKQCIFRALNSEDRIIKNYEFWYAGREDRLLYGDDDSKLFSWVRIGVL